MKDTPSRIYRGLSMLTVAGLIIALALSADLITHPRQPALSPYFGSFLDRWLFGFVIALINISIGLLCMRRAPGNVIGPMLVLYGAGMTSQSLRTSFDPTLAGVLMYLGGFFSWGSFFIIMLLFPDGQPHPRWMRWFIRVLVLVLMLSVPLYVFGAPQYSSQLLDNPLSIPLITKLYSLLWPAITALTLSTVAALPVSIFLRYRAGTATIRAQLRWIFWGMLIMALVFAAQLIAAALGLNDLREILGIIGTALVFTVPPFAIGNAILRHRLYDIDIIIRRTLTYSAITVLLAGAYFGAVTVLQGVFARFIGGESPLAIVASTLLIAALFTPLRRRVQSFVDRRFNRSRYDAAQTLDRFGDVARDEVNLEKLEAALLSVVDETMQPVQVSLWVNEPSRARPSSQNSA